MSCRVTRRQVFYVSGYDWKSWQFYAELFRRELDRHCSRTGSSASLAEPAVADDALSVTWRAEVSAPDGPPVETVYEFLLWDDVIERHRRRSLAMRLVLMIAALFDNVRTLTLMRIASLNWRFALFWIYPVAMMLVFVALGVFFGASAFDLAGGEIDSIWVRALAGAGVGVVTFYAALVIVERRNGLVLMLLDALIFNAFHVRRRDRTMNARIGQWIARVAGTLDDAALDEVLIIGHSWGTMHAVEIGAALAERLDGGARAYPAVSVITVGSTTPAVARHPASGWLRGHIAALARSPSVLWVEYQARKDFINFPETDPVDGAGASVPADERHATLVRQIRFRDMLKPEFYQTIRNNLFRLHFQFLMANDVADQPYDFFDIVSGPQTLWRRNGLVAPNEATTVGITHQ